MIQTKNLEKAIGFVGIALTSIGLAITVGNVKAWIFWISGILLIIAALISLFINE